LLPNVSLSTTAAHSLGSVNILVHQLMWRAMRHAMHSRRLRPTNQFNDANILSLRVATAVRQEVVVNA
jgi:hypothetical protein